MHACREKEVRPARPGGQKGPNPRQVPACGEGSGVEGRNPKPLHHHKGHLHPLGDHLRRRGCVLVRPRRRTELPLTRKPAVLVLPYGKVPMSPGGGRELRRIGQLSRGAGHAGPPQAEGDPLGPKYLLRARAKVQGWAGVRSAPWARTRLPEALQRRARQWTGEQHRPGRQAAGPTVRPRRSQQRGVPRQPRLTRGRPSGREAAGGQEAGRRARALGQAASRQCFPSRRERPWAEP